MTPEILWPITTALLGAAIAYACLQYATRNKRKDKRSEEATRRLYETPTRDDLES